MESTLGIVRWEIKRADSHPGVEMAAPHPVPCWFVPTLREFFSINSPHIWSSPEPCRDPTAPWISPDSSPAHVPCLVWPDPHSSLQESPPSSPSGFLCPSASPFPALALMHMPFPLPGSSSHPLFHLANLYVPFRPQLKCHFPRRISHTWIGLCHTHSLLLLLLHHPNYCFY